MCGIWAYVNLLKNDVAYEYLFNDFMKIKARGPDMSSFQIIKNVYIGFHRLAIMDPTFHANQPYIIEDNERTIVFICNGEIYNFKELVKNHNLNMSHNSDCLTIPLLYIKSKNINEFVELFKNEIKGEFAFILFEFDNLQNIKQVIAGRDQIGIRPLYYHPMTKPEIIFSSELKGLSSFECEIKEFEPATILQINIDSFNNLNTTYFNYKNVYQTKELFDGKYLTPNEINNKEQELLTLIRNAVINSVKRRLIADRPIAFLLSGGVDSSLVAAIAAKLLNQPINTYCCGMNEGTDLEYARLVANHIKSNHKEVFFTPEQGLKAIDDVIYTTETWDTTTVRASVGQYLVCKYIGEQTDARVVMVGEGPDEVCSSYLFNYNAPNGEELHKAAKEYVEKIHLFDGRRADRCISRWGLEGRIALLDPEFINAYWSIPAEWRHPKYKGIEKYWLRKAFEGTDILPDKVLWRKKEAFSDGVSGKTKSWFEIIQEDIINKLGNVELGNCPTLEAYYYQQIFIKHFGKERLNILPHYWQPKWTGSDRYVDPSARTLEIYNF